MEKTPALPPTPPELADLESRHTKIRGERVEVEAALRQFQDDAWRKSRADIDVLDLAASRLADGLTDAAGRAVLPEQAEVMRSRLDLLQRAEFKMRAKLHELRDLHHTRVARAYRPAHRAAVAGIHKALVALVAANIAEEELRARVPGGKLRPANFPNCGRFGTNGGPAEFWRAWARREGLIDKDDDQVDWPAAAL